MCVPPASERPGENRIGMTEKPFLTFGGYDALKSCTVICLRHDPLLRYARTSPQ